MARLSKATAVAAVTEVSELIGGFKTEKGTDATPDASLKTAAYYPVVHQTFLDIELDKDDRKELSEETIAVIDALAKKFPDMTVSSEEEEEAPAPKKEKKGKKEKKNKKEVPAEAPAPAKEKKSKKNKKAPKGKVDPATIAEDLKNNKSINKAEMLELVETHAAIIGEENVATLQAIKNPMSLKKAIRDALVGNPIEVKTPKPRTKKEKAPAAPSLTEQIENADLDGLRVICKANKESFPGVKAKKFEKAKKLKKAMLAVFVEPVAKKRQPSKSGRTREETQALRQKQLAFLTKTVKKTGSIDRKELIEAGIAEFPDDAKGVKDMISYGQNPKYNKFEALLVKDDDDVLSFEGTKKSKKSKKSKKQAPVEATPAPSKKEKKGKKDKKKKSKK